MTDIEVSVSVGSLSVCIVGEGPVRVPDDKSKSRKASWASDSLYCKLDCGFYGVDVAVEVIDVASFEGTTGVIYILFPELGWLGVCGKGS